MSLIKAKRNHERNAHVPHRKQIKPNQMHPKFNTLNEEQKQEVIAFAKMLMENDSFFITMARQEGKEPAIRSAISTATNKFFQQSFHAQFGERNF